MSTIIEEDRGNAASKTKHSYDKPVMRARHVVPSRHIRALASRLISLRAKSDEHKTIGITSVHDGTGTTTIASNLAVAVNSAVEGEVLLVDTVEPQKGHARRPKHPGWFDFVFGDAELSDIVMPTDVPKLSVIGYGSISGPSIGTYNSDKLANIAQFLKERYEFVIFDLPSASDMGGCVPVASVLDGILLVLKAGHVSSSDAIRFQHELSIQGANVIGAVLNQTQSVVPRFLRGWIGSGD